MKNPYAGRQVDSAKSAYHVRCANCHGENGEGTGNIPALATGAAQSASDGELFWYITKGDVDNGMPSWETLSRKGEMADRQLSSASWAAPNPALPAYALSSDEAAAAGVSAPPPTAPFHRLPFREARHGSQDHLK